MKALSSALVLLALVLICIFSCQRDISGGPEPNKPNEVEYVKATITGRVVDHDGKPIQGARVKSGAGNINATDINGYFRFIDIRVNENAAFVTVEKDGFFQGSRTIIARDGSINYVDIQLIKKTVAGTVSGSTGGTVTVPTGGTVLLPTNSVVNAGSGAAYTGTVSVSAFFLNPEATDFPSYMPGTLRGITTSNEERALQSFGMLAVELNGASNEKLQLANGKPATLTFPIPASLIATAPATIPLWYFNDSSGLWVEQGSATKQGNNYIGTVSHFSFWNCDWPYPVVDFKAVIKAQNGSALYPASVHLEAVGEKNISSYGYTDDQGVVSGKVPTGKTYKLTVLNRCGTPLYTGTVGPYTNDADLGTVTVTGGNGYQLTISGTVVNCTMAPLANGYVDIFVDGIIQRALVTNGNFSHTFTRCNNTSVLATVTPVDAVNAVSGTPTDVPINSGTVATGQLLACGNTIPEFVNLTLRSTDYKFLPPADSITMYKQGASFSIYATHKSNSNRDGVSFGFSASGTGTVPLDYANASNGDTTFSKNGAISLNITEFGAVGGYIAGNFSGTLKSTDSSGAPPTAPANVTFRVRRTN